MTHFGFHMSRRTTLVGDCRVRAILRKQEKRPGPAMCGADHQRGPNAYFAKLGLFARHTA